MTFKAYTHIERLGKEQTEGILNGVCEITPKLDGTNGSIWMDGNEICCGSRTRKLISSTDDNAGFYQWINLFDETEPIKLRTFLYTHPRITIYGEWMGRNKFIGHIKDYNPETKGHMYIFDMYDNKAGRYLTSDEWRPMAKTYKLEEYCVPILATLENPTLDQIAEVAKNNKFLLDHVNHAGEGVVIRNYNFINKFGNSCYAKFVLDEYVQKAKKNSKTSYAPGELEAEIIDRWVTDAELSKAQAKIALLFDKDIIDTTNGKMIGMYLNEVFNSAVLDEIGDIVKKTKDPTINFRTLRNLANVKCRKYIGLI